MKRKRPVGLALVAGTALVAALIGPAGAAGVHSGEVVDTCHGLPATIVGDGSGERLLGTAANDVIVSNGAEFVDAWGGNDSVCMTGAVRDTYNVRSGRGDDYVVITEPRAAYAVLGEGGDTYVGSEAADHVSAFGISNAERDPGREHISTGGGDDYVTLEHARGDFVDLGSGDDHLQAPPIVNLQAEFHGGPGHDELGLAGPVQRSVRDLVAVDNRTHVAKVDGRLVMRFRAFEEFDLAGTPSRRQTFQGSDANEGVNFSPTAIVTVDMRGGDDLIKIYPGTVVKDLLRGGTGRDTFGTYATDKFENFGQADVVTANLLTQTVRYVRPSGAIKVVRLGGINSLRILAPTVRLVGDEEPNVLDGSGCDVQVLGGDGDDLLTSTMDWGEDSAPACTSYPLTQEYDGQRGNDQLVGNYYDNTLIGGDGEDVADGRNGTDVCDAETQTNCEAHPQPGTLRTDGLP